MSQYDYDADLSSTAAIGLGSNLASAAGRPESALSGAISHLLAESVQFEAISRYYRTPAWPPGSGPGFVNAAALVRFPAGPKALLERLHAVEATFGRTRDLRWGPRTLDLDLLFFGATVAPDAAAQAHWRDLPPDRQQREAPDRMILPHPRLQDRAFVLIPLAEIAPTWRHPLTGRSVAEMAAALPAADTVGIEPFPIRQGRES